MKMCYKSVSKSAGNKINYSCRSLKLHKDPFPTVGISKTGAFPNEL